MDAITEIGRIIVNVFVVIFLSVLLGISIYACQRIINFIRFDLGLGLSCPSCLSFKAGKIQNRYKDSEQLLLKCRFCGYKWKVDRYPGPEA